MAAHDAMCVAVNRRLNQGEGNMKRNTTTVVSVTAMALAVVPATSQANADRLHVNVDASPGGDGSSWATAYHDLQDALADANTNGAVTEIWVAMGRYTPSGSNGLRSSTFQLIGDVGLYGGFIGTEVNRSDRDWKMNKTVLSGDLNGNDTGTNGIDENSYHVVTGSETGPTAVLDGFTITAGNANGGGLNNNGAGMINESGSPTVRNCDFIANSAAFAGGGMQNRFNHPTVTDCVFRDNSATNFGGGMHNDPTSSPVITNCTFLGNQSDVGAGMGNNADSNPKLINCIFSGNVAGTRGGALQVRTSFTVTNCTITGNVGGTSGGGLAVEIGSPTLTNCIVWGNTAQNSAQIAGNASVTYSCVEGGWAGVGNIDLDPQFVDSNGFDGIIGTEDDDVRLGLGSPCIDVGTNGADTDTASNGIQLLPSIDIAGNPRIVNGIVDLGAHEYFVDCNTNGVSDDLELSGNDCDTNGLLDECEPDSDADGVINACDNCTTNGNPSQENFDGDGFGDVCDPDIDDDGVPNELDACDYTPLGVPIITDPASCLYGTLRFDADGDCDVDLADFAVMQGQFTGPN
jgi:hypothetical protein